MLTRRKILQSSLLAAPALILPDKRIIKPAWSQCVGAGAPAVAAAFGLNTRTFHDPCTSLATVDVNNTQQPGFLWYPNTAWPNAAIEGWAQWEVILSSPPTPPGDITYSNGIVVSGTHATYAAQLYSAYPKGPGQFGGTVINMANAAFFQCTFQSDVSLANETVPSWPAFWSDGIEMFIGTATHFAELDFFEQSPNVPSQVWFGIHDWDMLAQTNNVNSNFDANPSAFWTSDVFTAGTLYLSPTFNGGTTGTLQRYLKNVTQNIDYGLLSAYSVSFSAGAGASPAATPANPTGVFAEMGSQHHMLILSGGFNWPMTVTDVSVWQRTASG